MTKAIGPLEQLGRLVDLAGEGSGLGQPEGAEQERALVPGQAVRRQVAVDQAPLVRQALLDGVDRGQHRGGRGDR